MNINNRILLSFFALILFASVGHATELGVNYYHETLTDANGVPYLPRTLEGVAQDMQDIKDISSHVKLFANPYKETNMAWTLQVADVAKANGMHVAVAMMVDDRQIDNSNWEIYRTNVLKACADFSGKADEFLVGNEITLHSGMSREEIRDKVVPLMAECDAVFAGPVSYQEFWYAHEVWLGRSERIQFMMYENIGTFQGNMVELKTKFPGAVIGEWGEDQLEDQTARDEAWQKDQIAQRWAIIQEANVPLAYIFTYREFSDNGFGIIRGDGSRRPLWEVFGAASTPPAQQAPPVVEIPTCVATDEVLDGADNNCNGQVDEGVQPVEVTEQPSAPVNETNKTVTPDTQEQVPETTSTGGGSGSKRKKRSSGGGGIMLNDGRAYSRTTLQDDVVVSPWTRSSVRSTMLATTNSTNSTNRTMSKYTSPVSKNTVGSTVRSTRANARANECSTYWCRMTGGNYFYRSSVTLKPRD